MASMDEITEAAPTQLANAGRHHLTLDLAETARLALPMA
jgi:hypothetical protein